MVEVTNAETSADCVVMGEYNWSLRFFFFFLAAGYSISCQRRNSGISDVLPLHAPLRPPDWQLWSAHWQTTRLKGIKEAGTPPSHKLPKKSKLLWERSTLGSQLPRKITAAAINKHKLRESSWATRPSRQANSNQSQWRYDRGIQAAK